MNTQEDIDNSLIRLDSFETVFKELSKQMLTPPQQLFALDMLAVAVINRSLSLISGFTTLIRSKNYIGAAHLARPHLDNYLRFYAAWLVKDPHEFAMKIMEGKRIDQLADQNGKLLKDYYLVEIASIDFPWIKNVYKETSGFVHLSKKHIFTSTKLQDKADRTIEFRVGKEDQYVQDESKIEAIECMIEITNCVISLLEGWIWTKSNPGKLEELKKQDFG